MKKTNKLICFSIAALICSSIFVHPFGAVTQSRIDRPLLTGANIDPQTAGLLIRSCQDCHSERTTWPWYSHVPVASWLLERDVSRARRSMNLSHWNDYTPDERQAHLAIIGAAVRNRQMPPPAFLTFRRDARLSPAEREQIYNWAHAERRRLRRSALQMTPAGHTR